MRVVLTPPAGWRLETETRMVSADPRSPATITIGAIRALPDDLQAWVTEAMGADLPAGAETRILGMVKHETGKGWPWRLVDAVVVAGDKPIERRLGAFYRFFEYGAVALVRSPGPDIDDRLAQAAVHSLATAEPDWSSRVVAPHQLWEGVEHSMSCHSARLGDVLPGWRVRYLADGVALAPPEGRAAGGIRVRERIQPLRGARHVIDWVTDQMRFFGSLSVTTLERMVTCEGEHGATFTVTALRGEVPYERTVGLVWGDDFYTQIDGGTDDAASFARFRHGVRDLTYLHSLGLGERRRRRFVYAPPPGWRGYPRGLIAEWYAPDFPKDHGFISVFAARVGEDSTPSQLDRLLHEMSWFGFQRESLNGPEEVSSADGLKGHRWRPVGKFRGGARLFFDVVVLYDKRFSYVLRLESRSERLEEHRRLFADMVRSVEQLPVPNSGRPAALFADMFS
jgi:hypothetical protein